MSSTKCPDVFEKKLWSIWCFTSGGLICSSSLQWSPGSPTLWEQGKPVSEQCLMTPEVIVFINDLNLNNIFFSMLAWSYLGGKLCTTIRWRFIYIKWKHVYWRSFCSQCALRASAKVDKRETLQHVSVIQQNCVIMKYFLLLQVKLLHGAYIHNRVILSPACDFLVEKSSWRTLRYVENCGSDQSKDKWKTTLMIFLTKFYETL